MVVEMLTVILQVTSNSLVDGNYQYFRGVYHLHLQGKKVGQDGYVKNLQSGEWSVKVGK
jgi:hypothetical protein